MKRHQVVWRLRNSAHDEICELEAACAKLTPDAEDGRSSEEPTVVVLAVQFSALSALLTQFELELAKRNLLRTLH